MEQQTFAEVMFQQHRTPTRQGGFLEETKPVLARAELTTAIELLNPKPEAAGRPLVRVDRMLRIHCLQECSNLSDPAVQEGLYDLRAMRLFVGIDLSRESVSDETTICKFRHLPGGPPVGRITLCANPEVADLAGPADELKIDPEAQALFTF